MENYDIPVMPVGAAVSQLEELYAAAWEQGCLADMPSVQLLGGVGVGKSTLVRTLADRLSARFGQEEVVVRDIRLLHFSPIDLRGVPAPDRNHEFTVWLKPKLFDLPEDQVSILFLDEITSAPQSLQAAAYQIALDKCIGEFALPKNTIVITAGNRTTDRSVVNRMPKALANRLIHLQIEADYDSWVHWAVEAGVDARVIGYLGFDQSRLNKEPGVESLAFPTPRSWEFVSRLLKTTGKDPEQLHELLSGCVGVAQAEEFETWCRSCNSLPQTEDILNGFAAQVKRADALYAVMSSLLTCVRNRGEKLTQRELTNVCSYVGGMPIDFGAMFYRVLMDMKGMRGKLLKCSPFLAWMKRNQRFI